VIFDGTRTKVLLTRRADNGLWCLPGGRVESGESVAEACEREVWEETGLRSRVERLIGVYSNPDQLVVYPDGERAFFVVLAFEASITGGTLGLSDETTETGFFSVTEMESLPIHARHDDRVRDAFADQKEAMIR
jgi:ADP-ribose pyrophosphatase YjhB (NUDIX family)